MPNEGASRFWRSFQAFVPDTKEVEVPLMDLMDARMRALADQASAQAEAIRRNNIEIDRQFMQRQFMQREEGAVPRFQELDSPQEDDDDDEDDDDQDEDEDEEDSPFEQPSPALDALMQWVAEDSDPTDRRPELPRAEVRANNEISRLWPIIKQFNQILTLDANQVQVTWPLPGGEIGFAFLRWLASQTYWARIYTPATAHANLESLGWVGVCKDSVVVWTRKPEPAPIELEF